MSTHVDKIRSRGHWLVRLHPDVDQATEHVQLSHLEKAVKECAVDLRGWDFPHWDTHSEPKRLPHSVEQGIDWQHYVELWRAYRSGQFVSLLGIEDDWRDQSGLWPQYAGWKPGQVIRAEDVVFSFVEWFEFATRWATRLEFTSALVLDCTVHGIEGRHMAPSEQSVPYLRAAPCSAREWQWRRTYTLPDLLAGGRELAVAPAVELFELFGWDGGPQVVRDIQQRLRG